MIYDNMFNLPESVIFELSSDDFRGAAAEYEDFGFDAAPHRSLPSRAPKTVACPDCGLKGLRWAETENGDRLLYTEDAKVPRRIVGLIHACEP